MNSDGLRWCLTGIVLLLAACNKTPQPPQKNGPPPAVVRDDPRHLLDQMVSTYREATAYRDRGKLRLQYRQGGELTTDEAVLAVEFQRPGKLQLRAYMAHVTADGQTLHAFIEDAGSANIDNQILVRPLAGKLTVPDVYADPILNDTIASGLGGYPVQLDLLLGEDPLKPFLTGDSKLDLLEDVTIEDRPCRQVKVTGQAGSFLFAIDEQSHILRRLTFPPASLLPDLASDSTVSEIEIVAEFRSARFGGDFADDAFDFNLPPQAKVVRWFVLPPESFPTALLGKKPGKFQFSDMTGKPVDTGNRVRVLAWFTDHLACRANLEQLAQVHRGMKDDDRVAFLAVNGDPAAEMTDTRLKALANNWKIPFPVVRDSQAFGKSAFQITELPCLVVLDADGNVQMFDQGFNPRLHEHLPLVVHRLLAGENVAAGVLDLVARSRQAYDDELKAATNTAGQVAAREATEPQRFELKPAWQSQDLSAPGNILTVVDGEATRLVVMDGWRTVVELDVDGKLIARHELDLPEKASISFLKTTLDASGRRWYAATSVLSRQVFVFDAKWQRVLSYPPVDQPHPGIRDIAIADLTSDGEPELLVGFWDDLGLHCVGMTGERIWHSRLVPTVLAVAIERANDAGQWNVLVTGDQNEFVRFDPQGKPAPLDRLSNPATDLAAASFAPTDEDDSVWCAVTVTARGQRVAVGMNAGFERLWEFDLPPGNFENQIRYIASGSLPPAIANGVWWIAAPDGTVDVIGADGTLSDSFSIGDRPAGIASVDVKGKRRLVISAGGRVSAFEL